jgi:putative RNA 2'-phosphotransferase
MKKLNYKTLSKTVALALRHKPWLFELELDDDGWAPVGDLLGVLQERRAEWADLSEADLDTMISLADKPRYEMRQGRIRALYGHSLAHKLAKTPAKPPEILYHGTPQSAVRTILAEGLKPMGRQYVHLSAGRDTAQQVGSRKDNRPAMLAIMAAEAHINGVPFYQGNEMVWLADYVPPQFIEIVP